jgi:hypothetical protein
MSCIDPPTFSLSLSLSISLSAMIWNGERRKAPVCNMLSHYTVHATAADVFSAARASLIATFRKTNVGMDRADYNKQICIGQILKYNVGCCNLPNSNKTDVMRPLVYSFLYLYLWFTENLYLCKETTVNILLCLSTKFVV